MSKTIDFKIPRSDGSIANAVGTVAVFQIGNEKIRFVMQSNGEFVGVSLVHHASGNIAVRHDTITMKKIRHTHGGKTLTDREACRLCLEDLVDRIGEARVLSGIRAAKVIN